MCVSCDDIEDVLANLHNDCFRFRSNNEYVESTLWTVLYSLYIHFPVSRSLLNGVLECSQTGQLSRGQMG